jgi:integrase
VPTFTEVVEKHLYFYPKRSTDAQFHRSVCRFLNLNGDLRIDQYRRAHGNAFVEDMHRSELKRETMKRYLNQIRPVFETARMELEISMSNPLSKLKIPEDVDDPKSKRASFTLEQIRAIQSHCRKTNDQFRWCISILSDTGARLSEIAGLLKEDVRIENQTPHIAIVRNEVRSLKPGASERLVPLVGEARWAAQQALCDNSTPYLFPGFIKDGKINSGAISATLNKWLKEKRLRGKNQPLHSFRHTLRDRLRNSGCPPDAADRIGGWKRQGVGESYGQGHSISVLHSYMLKMLEVEEQSEGET